MARLRFLVAGAVIALFCVSSLSADWPFFRGNPAQTGVTAEKLPDKLDIRWQTKLKRGIGSTAAIVDGIIYIGCYDEHLYAFDLKTGDQKWMFKGGSFKAAPSFYQGAIYIGDEDGTFYCVDAAKGAERWHFETDFTITGGANFAGNLVLFAAHDSTLYALDRDKGKLAWKYKTKQGPIYGSTVIADNQTFVAGCDSMLHIVSVKDGKGIAQIELSGQSGSTTAFRDGTLYVPNMGSEVQAIDLAKQKIIWSFAPNPVQGFNSSAAVTDKRVFVGGDEGNVHAIDAVKGTEIWKFETNKGRIESSPVVAGNRVYVGTTSGDLFVLDTDKGTKIQEMKLGRGIVGSPAVSDGCLVIGTTDGKLYCLGKK